MKRLVEQQRFTVLEVAADWYDGTCGATRCTTDIPPPQSATLGLHPVARRLLLINRPRRDGTLSWHWYTAAMHGQESNPRPRDRKSGNVSHGHHRICPDCGKVLSNILDIFGLMVQSTEMLFSSWASWAGDWWRRPAMFELLCFCFNGFPLRCNDSVLLHHDFIDDDRPQWDSLL